MGANAPPVPAKAAAAQPHGYLDDEGTGPHAHNERKSEPFNKFTVLTLLFQIALIVLFGTCTEFAPTLNGQVVPVANGPGTVLPAQVRPPSPCQG